MKMKELSVISVAPLSCPCKTVNTRFPILVTLGVYHVRRNSSYCMITPRLVRKPHATNTDPHLLRLRPGSSVVITQHVSQSKPVVTLLLGSMPLVSASCTNTRAHEGKQRPWLLHCHSRYHMLTFHKWFISSFSQALL